MERVDKFFVFLIIIIICVLSIIPSLQGDEVVRCSDLRMGQFRCNTTANIDPLTQQPMGCTKENVAIIDCEAVNGLICEESDTRIFKKEIACKYTNGYSYSTTLLLSVFLGMLGADRFYLGYVGMGALKFCTLGFLFVGHILDIILVATQNVRPKDGSNYIVGFYGPTVQHLRANNLTYIVPRADWYGPVRP